MPAGEADPPAVCPHGGRRFGLRALPPRLRGSDPIRHLFQRATQAVRAGIHAGQDWDGHLGAAARPEQAGPSAADVLLCGGALGSEHAGEEGGRSVVRIQQAVESVSTLPGGQRMPGFGVI